MRLIDADELKETIFEKTDSLEDIWDTAGVLNAINNAPTIEGEILTEEAYSDLCLRASRERPQGEWIRKQVTPASCTYFCSECGIEEVILGNFCRWCGADMRGANGKVDS